MKYQNRNKVEYIYNSKKFKDRKLLGYIKAAKGKILARDVTKDPFTETQLANLAKSLDSDIASLVDREHVASVGDEHILHIEEAELPRVLKNNPIYMQTPLVVEGKKAKYVGSIDDVTSFEGFSASAYYQKFQQ